MPEDKPDLKLAPVIGRPPKKSKKLLAEICFRIANGRTLLDICRDDDMPHRSTVLDWANKDETFSDTLKEAKARCLQYRADEVFDIADNGTNDWMERTLANGDTIEVVNHEHIQRSKLRIDTRLKMLAILDANNYSEKVKAAKALGEASKQQGGPIRVEFGPTPEGLKLLDNLMSNRPGALPAPEAKKVKNMAGR